MKTIVITGALGNIGAKLCQHLGPQYRIVALDQRDGSLDIRQPVSPLLFEGAEAVIHLAAASSYEMDEVTVTDANVIGFDHVLDATTQAGISRFVFASSNWVMAGYRHKEGLISEDMPPRPVTPYGWSKLYGEQRLERWASDGARTAVSFRIGALPFRNGPGEAFAPDQVSPGWRDDPELFRWIREMWVSDEDACAAFSGALRFCVPGHHVANLMSGVAGCRWPLERRALFIG